MTKTATHATASIQFGQLDSDGHVIRVETYRGLEDKHPVESTVQVGDARWDAAFGSSDTEKICSILDWTGNTEHDREYVHVTF